MIVQKLQDIALAWPLYTKHNLLLLARYASKMAHEIPTAEECTTVASNLEAIMERIRRATDEAEKGPYFRDRRPELVAVSKTKHPLLVESV